MEFGVQDIEGGDFTLFREGEEGMKQGDEVTLVFGEEVLKDRVFGEVYGPEGRGCLLGRVGVCACMRGCLFMGLGSFAVGGVCHGFFHVFLLMGVKVVFLSFLPMQNPIRFLGKREKK